MRGGLPEEEPGARGIERIARNPSCQLLRSLTIAGILPASAVTAVYGDVSREGQSPFALNAGNNFEREVIGNNAARLLQLYRERGRLKVDECKVAVVPDLASGRGRGAVTRRRITMQLLSQKINGDPRAPNIIIKPRLAINLLGLEHGVELDALVAADDEPFYRPVEIKSYPDRQGKTDPADIRSACRQAAVYIIALRQATEQLRVFDPWNFVPAKGDLVLRVPGSYSPTLYSMGMEGEVDSLERALDEAPRNLGELEQLIGQIGLNATLDNPATLDAIPHRYRESCREHCALAARCKQRAIQNSDLVLLGEQAREELVAVGTISRAIDLLNTTGAGQVREHMAQEERASLFDQDGSPLSNELGHHRILRTSPLTEVPFVC